MKAKYKLIEAADELAGELMLLGAEEASVLERTFRNGDIFWKLEYRSNKSASDIELAMKKAKDPKKSFYRAEMEISMFALYLRDIFKVAA